MFLDETHNWPRREEPPPRPTGHARRERVLGRIFLGYALILLLLPISLGSAVDLIRWLMALFG